MRGAPAIGVAPGSPGVAFEPMSKPMDSKCKHTFQLSCEGLEGRQLLSSTVNTLASSGGVAPTLPVSPLLAPYRQFSPRLQAVFEIRPSGLLDYPYGAIIEGLELGSPLAKVTLNDGRTLTLGPGDEILSLDNLPVNANGSNLEYHFGVTSIVFVQQGSTVVLNGTFNI